ncbi:MAG: molecular chaperone DnaJ [Alphaproteobacteria bacterium]
MTKCFYELLEVEKTADETQLKKSYRKLAMQYHPDRNPNNPEAEAKFKEISVAYEILSNPDKRAAYDRYGHAAFENGGGGQGGFGGFEGFDFSDMFGDIFSDFFGGGASRSRRNPNAPQKGQDMQMSIEISLEEAFWGLNKEIKIPTKVKCDDCDGTGSADGSQPQTCPQCNGRGKVVSSAGGFFMMETVCPRCKGKGHIIVNKCKTCNGTGLKTEEKKIEVKIPAGVDNQVNLRITGAGEAGKNGGPSGDLYVVVFVKEHEIYQREQENLYIKLPISMTTAALGNKIEIKGIDDEAISFEVEAGTQNGDVQKIKGKGMSSLRSSKRGDLYVEFFVQTPKGLNSKQKQLLKEFKALEKEDKGFLENFKDFLKVG